MDKNLIPKGIYCYEEKELCPYFSSIEKAGIKLPYCKFLKKGGISNGISDEDFEKLKSFHHTTSDEDIWDLYPLDLLWDQVKECGENEEDFLCEECGIYPADYPSKTCSCCDAYKEHY